MHTPFFANRTPSADSLNHRSHEPDPRSVSAGPPCDEPADFGRRLRDATGPAHRLLDAEFVDVATDNAVYCRFLAMNHAVHHRLEPLIEAASEQHAFFATFQPMRARLSEDMQAMGIEPLRAAPCEAVRVPRDNLTMAAGMLYVLEGSRLGARAIVRDLDASPLRRSYHTVSTCFLAAAAERFDFRGRMKRLGEVLCQSGGDAAWLRAEEAARQAFAVYSSHARQARSVCRNGAVAASEEV